MTQQCDDIVAEYLAQVERAAAELPPHHRNELLRDLREHIDTERAMLATETEAQVRTILDRLGEPDAIAAAADARESLPGSTGTSLPAGGWRGRALTRTVILALTAVALFACVLTFLFFASASRGG